MKTDNAGCPDSGIVSKPRPDFSIENSYCERGFRAVCGIDEAGRGPLLGPVVAAACVLPAGFELPGLNDSKKLTAKSRGRFYEIITGQAVSYAVGQASVEEINRLNILEATLLAMRRAAAMLDPAPDLLLIDGRDARGFAIPAVAVTGGDAISCSIAAASILAKVTRDRICLELDKEYPGYGIARHKGYGTREHIEMIKKLGLTPEHRKLFVRNFVGD